MTALPAEVQDLVTLTSQIDCNLLEICQLLESSGGVPTDLRGILNECGSLSKYLNLYVARISRSLETLSLGHVWSDCFDDCKPSLQHSCAIMYETALSLRSLKSRNSVRKLMSRRTSPQQKQALEVCKSHLHTASRLLDSAMLQPKVLQALARIDFMPILQRYREDPQYLDRDILIPDLHRPGFGHIYPETNVSGNAQVTQGDVYNTYNYMCSPLPHAHDGRNVIMKHQMLSSIIPCDQSTNQQQEGNASNHLQDLQVSTSRLRVTPPTTAPTFNSEPKSSRSTISTVSPQARWQLLLPFRWLGWVCHLQAIRAHGRWTFNFTIWNILQQDAPILHSIENNDLSDFQQLIQSGRYTIYDRDQRGQTLLMHAISEAAMDIVQFLLFRDRMMARESIGHSFIGSSGTFSCFVLVSCIQYFLESYSRRPQEGPSTGITQFLHILDNLFDIVRDQGLVEEESAWGGRIYIRTPISQSLVSVEPRLSQAVSQSMTRKLFSEDTDIGINSRVGWAVYASNIRCFWDFWILLGKADLDLACVEAQLLKDERGTILTHCADLFAISMGNETCWPPPAMDESYTRLVRQAFDLHDLERSFGRKTSPLLSVITSCISGSPARSILTRTKKVLWRWLEVLNDLGVDLWEYGRQEHEFFETNGTYEFDYRGFDTGIEYQIRLLGFQWGKCADQWQSWFCTSEDQIACTFMGNHLIAAGRLPSTTSPTVDISSRSMPGAWIDDSYKEKQSVPLERYMERTARSRRRRKRHLTAAGYHMRDARVAFGSLPFHDYVRYHPREQKEDCRSHCFEFSSCFPSQWLS